MCTINFPYHDILYLYHEKGNTYMPKGTNQKLKLYRLAQIMLENTDDEHYITMPEIMEELGKYEVTADRKTIYQICVICLYSGSR